MLLQQSKRAIRLGKVITSQSLFVGASLSSAKTTTLFVSSNNIKKADFSKSFSSTCFVSQQQQKNINTNMSTAGIYKTALPSSPRTHGIAKVTFGAAAAGAETTVVQFRTKEEVPSSSSLAAKDAEKESVQVSYATENGVEVRNFSVSIGPAAKVDSSGLRKAAVAVVAKLRALKTANVNVILPTNIEGIPNPKVAEIVVQALTLSNFHFDRYLTGEDKVPFFVDTFNLSVKEGTADVAAVQASALAQATLSECVIFARDLVNERADEMHPDRMEEVAAAVAAETGATMTVLKGEALVKEGLHLLAAVGQSARHAPRYIELVYKGDPANPNDVIMVVGKGITFDSGGLNIKGTGFMEEMHMDMGGSAAALGSCLAAHRLGLKRNVVFIAAVAENAIDALSFKPHNIIKSHKGYTVEIGNTDAEGRLVLADALSYGQSRHKPHTIMDMATLTGACIIALGEYAAGLFTNNAALRTGLQAAAEAKWERLWPMPIFPEHREELRASSMADLQSTGAGRYGGSCTAAAFLENFIGHEPAPNARNKSAATGAGDGAASSSSSTTTNVIPAWAHIDLAGPAMYGKTRSFMNAGGTGFGVQVITQYLLNAPAGAPAADEIKKY